jgi:hypothetical protein
MKSPAKRARLYRERLKMGVRVIPTPVGGDEVQNLIAAGLLTERDEADAALVADALTRATHLLPLRKRA